MNKKRDRRPASLRRAGVGEARERRTHCKGRRRGGILAFRKQKKSPLQERAVFILNRCNGLGMEAVSIGVTACQEYITRQTLKQDHSAPSLSRTR